MRFCRASNMSRGTFLKTGRRMRSGEVMTNVIDSNQNDQCSQQVNETDKGRTESSDKKGRRFNQINIQMLSRSIHEQVFLNEPKQSDLKREEFGRVKDHLKVHGLWGKECTILNDVDFEIPDLTGKNISEHFENIANEQIYRYLELAKEIANGQPPPIPNRWLFQAGWTKYSNDGTTEKVCCPEDDAFVFDVEICMNDSELPVMATAASPNAWYDYRYPISKLNLESKL